MATFAGGRLVRRVFVSPRSARREDERDPDRKQTMIATLLAIRISLALARPAGPRPRPATRTRVTGRPPTKGRILTPAGRPARGRATAVASVACSGLPSVYVRCLRCSVFEIRYLRQPPLSRDSGALFDLHHPAALDVVERLHSAARPADFDRVGARGGAETEMETQVVVRGVAGLAQRDG